MNEPMANGYIYERVLSKSSLMNMTGFRWFSKIWASFCFGQKVASALEGLTDVCCSCTCYPYTCLIFNKVSNYHIVGSGESKVSYRLEVEILIRAITVLRIFCKLILDSKVNVKSINPYAAGG